MEYILVPFRSCFGLPETIFRTAGSFLGTGPNFRTRTTAASHGGRLAATVDDPTAVPVTLDTLNMGNDVVIVKNGHRICGSGAALATVPLLQSKAYFEVKVQQTGIWGVGIGLGEGVDLNRVPLGQDGVSWVLTHEGTLRHDGVAVHTIAAEEARPNEGDILGVAFDHVQLTFFINGKKIDYSMGGIKSSVGGANFYPAVYVDDGAILDANFRGPFAYDPPDGFDRIIAEKSLL